MKQTFISNLYHPSREFIVDSKEERILALLEAIPHKALIEITVDMAWLYRIIPIRLHGMTIFLASDHPEKNKITEELGLFLGREIRILSCSEKTIDEALARYFPPNTSAYPCSYHDDDEQISRTWEV